MPPDLNVPEGMLHGSAPAFGGRRLTTQTDYASPSLASKFRHFKDRINDSVAQFNSERHIWSMKFSPLK